MTIASTTESATSRSWLPDRNVLNGGIVGLVTWAILFVASYYGLDVPVSVQMAIPGVLAWAVTYLLPPSAKDVAKRLNDRIVALAAALPASAVSERTVVLPPATKVVAASTPAPAVVVPPAIDWNDRNKPKD